MILRALLAFWTSVASSMGDHLWQSTLFCVLAGILTLVLRKNQARVRYWVWLTASVKFLLPFSLLIVLGSHLAKPQVSTPAQVIVYSAVEDFSQPFAAQPIPIIYQSRPTATPVSLLHLLPAMVVALWLVGIVVVLLRGLIAWVRISRMVHEAASVGEGPEVEARRRLESSLGVRTPIRLVRSLDWMEPGIFGIFRPVLIWPDGLSKHLDDRHIEAILAHEVCHVRRHDNLTAVLHMLVEAVFWFHPLVWWMGARLEEERERACDEEVSILCNQPHVYAESILRVCKFCSESPLACVSGITGADLKKRVVQIMTAGVACKLTRAKKLLLAGVTVCVLAAPVALGMVRMIPLFGQILHADGPLPSFEVATIRPMELMHALSSPGGTAPRVAPNGEPIISQQEIRVSNAKPPAASNLVNETMTAKMLIADSYNLPAFSKAQIVGGLDWADQTMYQIKAKIDDAQYAAMQRMPREQQVQQVHLMEQSLLAVRFQLKVHFETRQLPVYALEIAKGGPKLTPAKTDSVPPGSAAPQDLPADMTVTGKGEGFEIKTRRASPGQLIMLLQQQQELGNRLVIDKTGLAGKYDMTLDWTREAAATADAGSAAGEAAPSFFTALKEQLGLELVETKGPAEVIVIDHIEKPTVDGAEVTQPALKVGTLTQLAANPAQSQPQNTAAPSPPYEYEAATIKPSKGPAMPGGKIGMWAAPDGFSAWFITPEQIISIAYGVKSFEISGGPSWLPSERFDIEAKMDAATADALAKLSKDQRELVQQQMLQALLADRFQLAVHRETKELTIYTLVIAKGGPKLQTAKPGDTYPNGVTYPDGTHAGADSMSGGVLDGKMTAQGVPIARLVLSLTQMLGHPVSDKTELKGVYDFKLRFTPDDRLQPPPGSPPNSRLPPPPADSNAPSLFDALQEQLGLKLESGKGPVEVIVVDHIERPSEN